MTAVTTGSAGPEVARRRRGAAVFVLSILFHGLVLGWFAVRQDRVLDDAEPAAVEAQILDIARLPRPPEPRADAETDTSPVIHLAPIAPRYVGRPATAGGGKGPAGVDLFGPVFADGQWPRPWTANLRDCDPATDPELSGPACRRELEVDRGVTRAYDPQQGTDEFAREARHNEAVRRYQELPGMAGFPGIGCHVFHKC